MDLMQSAKLLIENAVIYILLVLLKQNGNHLTVLILRKILFSHFPFIIWSIPVQGDAWSRWSELMPLLQKDSTEL